MKSFLLDPEFIKPGLGRAIGIAYLVTLGAYRGTRYSLSSPFVPRPALQQR
jgi:hypothetical protein